MQQKWNQNFDGEPMTDIPQKFLNAGCDVYMVMQLRHDEKILDERFASMRELHRRGKTPDPEHYEVTYYADLPAMWQDVPNNEILEELFQMFNLSRPQDFEGHSLSVSDVIAPGTGRGRTGGFTSPPLGAGGTGRKIGQAGAGEALPQLLRQGR